MKTKLTTLILLVALLFSANSLFAEEQQRNVDSFTGITLKIPGNLHIQQGEKQSIRIVAKESILDEIVTEVKDGKLIFRFEKDNFSFKSFKDNEIEFFVTNPVFNKLTISGSGNIIADSQISSNDMELSISGSGDIKINDLASQKIKVAISGSGDIELGGKKTAMELNIGISGSGEVNTTELAVENVHVKVSGSGDCTVYAEKTLEVKVSGSGDVFYKGKPQTDTSVSGSGSVKSIN